MRSGDKAIISLVALCSPIYPMFTLTGRCKSIYTSLRLSHHPYF
nr:MAG TPA_asm: hypothetical protein [Caudoviricetes sp.]DAT96039.1 MAG TPA: hypothetical protein [Caudoviricetes sp.]DAZ32446.1 MAG TPA: hypothetical protein [Caudoviricetes sp.]